MSWGAGRVGNGGSGLVGAREGGWRIAETGQRGSRTGLWKALRVGWGEISGA